MTEKKLAMEVLETLANHSIDCDEKLAQIISDARRLGFVILADNTQEVLNSFKHEAPLALKL